MKLRNPYQLFSYASDIFLNIALILGTIVARLKAVK